MTEAKAIRNSVEGRDVPRGPSATQLHERALGALRAAADELTPVRDALAEQATQDGAA